VREPGVGDLGIRADLFSKEPREDGCGCKAIEAVIVMEYPEFHRLDCVPIYGLN
jgi:hypothetical protein